MKFELVSRCTWENLLAVRSHAVVLIRHLFCCLRATSSELSSAARSSHDNALLFVCFLEGGRCLCSCLRLHVCFLIGSNSSTKLVQKSYNVGERTTTFYQDVDTNTVII